MKDDKSVAWGARSPRTRRPSRPFPSGSCPSHWKSPGPRQPGANVSQANGNTLRRWAYRAPADAVQQGVPPSNSVGSLTVNGYTSVEAGRSTGLWATGDLGAENRRGVDTQTLKLSSEGVYPQFGVDRRSTTGAIAVGQRPAEGTPSCIPVPLRRCGAGRGPVQWSPHAIAITYR